MDVLDLDVLRPAKRVIRLGGNEIDFSFLPLAITFDVAQLIDELNKLDTEKLAANDVAEVRKAFDIGIRLCVVFCEYHFPEMNEEWFRNNTTVQQVNVLVDAIKDALSRAYEGIPAKN